MIDPAAAACTAEGIRVSGLAIIVQRISGFAPRSVTFSAEVTAIVRLVIADAAAVTETGYGASNPGALNQDDRQIILMADDLKAARFPLPIVKGDKIIILATQDRFNVIRVDAYKRALAGAIELVATGLS